MKALKKTFPLIAALSLLSGCVNSIPFVPDREIVNRVFGAPSPRLEKRLQSLANDGYQQIIAFSRPDEKPMSEDDIKFLQANSPQGNSRLRRTDDNIFAAVGTNIPFNAQQFETLRQRFIFNDFSNRYVRQKIQTNNSAVFPTVNSNSNQSEANEKK